MTDYKVSSNYCYRLDHYSNDKSDMCSYLTFASVFLPGVTVLAVGMGQADIEELRRAVTDESTQNILYTPDATQLDSLHTNLAELLCRIAKIKEVKEKWSRAFCLSSSYLMVLVAHEDKHYIVSHFYIHIILQIQLFGNQYLMERAWS